MKRSVPLSLAGWIACGSVISGVSYANTVQDALRAGSVNGEIKYMYVNGSRTDANAAASLSNKTSQAAALHLNYLSGDFYGFTTGISFETSHDMTHNGQTKDARLAFSDSQLSQLYLKYGYGKSQIKLGRQYINTPLLKTNRGWAMYDSFDGLVLSTQAMANTELSGMVIKDWTTSWSNVEDHHYHDPVYSLYVRNHSLKPLTITGQYLKTDNNGNNGDIPVKTIDGYDTYFAQSDYKLPMSFPLMFSLQGGGANFDKVGEDDTWFYGAKLGTTLSGIHLETAYTAVDNDNDFPGTLGHVANGAMFNHMLINTSLFAGLDSLSLKGSYDFGQLGVSGLKTSLMMTHFEQSRTGMDNSVRDMDNSYEVDLDVKYAFQGMFKGLSTRIWLGYANYDLGVPADISDGAGATDDITYVRWFVNYRF